MPAKAGIHSHGPCLWIPAFAGMTVTESLAYFDARLRSFLRKGGRDGEDDRVLLRHRQPLLLSGGQSDGAARGRGRGPRALASALQRRADGTAGYGSVQGRAHLGSIRTGLSHARRRALGDLLRRALPRSPGGRGRLGGARARRAWGPPP